MIHLQALPGTPRNMHSPSQIIDMALKEAEILKKAGIDSIMIENMHDVPYLNRNVGHEISTLMAIIARQIKKLTAYPLECKYLLAQIKKRWLLQKLQVSTLFEPKVLCLPMWLMKDLWMPKQENYCGIEKQIGADAIAIFTDIKKKHSSHAITQDVSLLNTAKAAQFFRSDGVVVTGNNTGVPASIDDLKVLKSDLDFPVLVGSGITLENVAKYVPLCDAMIVGSYFKDKGQWQNDLNYDRVARFMDRVKETLI